MTQNQRNLIKSTLGFLGYLTIALYVILVPWVLAWVVSKGNSFVEALAELASKDEFWQLTVGLVVFVVVLFWVRSFIAAGDRSGSTM